MYTLYSMQRSGNSYKARLALAMLDIPYKLIEVDILRGESRTPDFLKKNPPVPASDPNAQMVKNIGAKMKTAANLLFTIWNNADSSMPRLLAARLIS